MEPAFKHFLLVFLYLAALWHKSATVQNIIFKETTVTNQYVDYRTTEGGEESRPNIIIIMADDLVSVYKNINQVH